LIENFIEPYHVPVVHRTSAGGQPLKEHYLIVDDRCVGCAVDVAGGVGESSVHDPCDHLDMSTRYLALFPNFVIAWYLPDQVGVHLNVPLAPDRTAQLRVIYHVGERPPDEAAVAALVELWTQVHREDHAIVEGLQSTRAFPVLADGGLLSPYWETSVRRFQELVVEAIA
jgi:choline monooxygenase